MFKIDMQPFGNEYSVASLSILIQRKELSTEDRCTDLQTRNVTCFVLIAHSNSFYSKPMTNKP